MTNFEIAILCLTCLSLLILICILVLIFHVALEGSSIKKKHAETHDKTIEMMNLLVHIMECKK